MHRYLLSQKFLPVLLSPISFILVTAFSSLFSFPSLLHGEHVSIGVILPLTGPASTMGESLRGIEKLLSGKHLRLHLEDDKCDPKLGLAAYQKLRRQGIKIFYAACSGTTLALAPFVLRNKELLMTTYAGSHRIQNLGKEVIQMNPNAASLAPAFFEMFLQNTKRVVLVHEEQEYSSSFADILASRLKDRLIKRIAYTPDGRSYSSEVLSIIANKPDVIVVIPVADRAAKQLFQELARYKVKTKILGEVNFCDYPFRAKDFGLEGECMATEFEGTAFEDFQREYKRVNAYTSVYPFNDALTLDLFLFLEKLVATKGAQLRRDEIQNTFRAGFHGRFARYAFSETGKILGAAEYVKRKGW